MALITVEINSIDVTEFWERSPQAGWDDPLNGRGAGRIMFAATVGAGFVPTDGQTIEIKEVKFRPNTDVHDYDVKMRNVFRFLENGDKVKVTLRFRGREMAHLDLGRKLLERVADDIVEIGKIENMPKMEGRQMIMMIGPAKYIL